jgi:hypothetical protein
MGVVVMEKGNRVKAKRERMAKEKVPHEVLAISLCQVALARLEIRVGIATTKKT